MENFKRVRELAHLLTVFSLILISACSSNVKDKRQSSVKNHSDSVQSSNIVSEKVTYKDGDETLIGYLFYNKNARDKKPGIIVVPEWWGNNDYPRMRAKMLAELGYIALSADIYGNGKVVDNPKDAQENAGKFYSNPTLMKSRMMAAYNFLNENEKVEKGKIAALGYCFGGSVCLNSASQGLPVKTVVSFHGGLEGFEASPSMKDVQTLICNGKADKSVTKKDIENFKNEMKKVDAPYEFREYDNATHAFTNPAATENGKKFNMPIAYNKEADQNSWNDMKEFFKNHFPPNE